MQMEPPVSLDCDAGLHPENIMIKDGDFCVTASPQNHDLLRPVPNSTKKQTRQWAAWTRQEEESFFTALRQVGKNFEKITCRVQSKNKDQVRHYYYRLVRRMNKLLGPGLCLDAKNSKDTNAAMLRWWSLLEKYSCKASKLHLKPRRFKIFVETLEHQLLKDRKKSKRKQPSQGENCPLSVPTTVSNQGRASGHDTHAVKLVLLDSQNIKKLGPAKGPSVRRNVNVGINRSSCKGDSFPAKTRQRRRPGIASTAAYKRWERAAIAGVSLVADAAEHLERTTTDKEVEHVHCTIGQKGFDPVGKDLPPLPTSSPNSFIENNIQTSTKLKLQLFPIDEGTRRSLEMDNHNPHLELTLSTRKKISSVLEHLNRKWGNSSVASGELMLFPYCVQRENLVGYRRWTHDSVVSAADVYQLIGSPPVFRLRYGWFSNAELASAISQACLVSSSMIRNLNMSCNGTKEQSEDSVLVPTSPIVHQSEKLIDHCNKDQQISEAENVAVVPSSTEMPDEMPDEIIGCIGVDGDNDILQSFDGAATVSWVRRETDNGTVLREGGNKDRRLRNGPSSSAGEWADSLTNISIGDLLSEVSHEIAANGVDPPIPGSSQCLQQGPFSCDSFDAAIAAHIYRHQNKTSFPPGLASLASSILDAEETCDAFSFQSTVLREELRTTRAIGSSEACKQIGRTCSAGSGATVELTEVEVHMDDKPVDEEPMDENPVDEGTEDGNPANGDLMDDSLSDPPILENSTKDLNGLTDIYWPDSLGPLDLDIPSSRYHTEDLILSDSLSGLNRLLASSLDAFHNCSFFGLDKKEMASTVEAQENCFLPRL